MAMPSSFRLDSTSPTGWQRVNLSGDLAEKTNNTFTVSDFAVTQNPLSDDYVDLALVVRVAGNDQLFMALDQPNDKRAWQSGVNWVYEPYDCPDIGTAFPLCIADVYLMNIPGTGGICFVDVIRPDTSPQNLLDRFYINMNVEPQWWFRPLPGDISDGSVMSVVGKRANDSVGKILHVWLRGNAAEVDLQSCPVARGSIPA